MNNEIVPLFSVSQRVNHDSGTVDVMMKWENYPSPILLPFILMTIAQNLFAKYEENGTLDPNFREQNEAILLESFEKALIEKYEGGTEEI